ncbi:hypothetical protein L4D76_24485 [Photobacterium sagamiensis]|uniref:hypothetical protein n=1 Tax=Photobacterium sagamiensis TaxID=2910241 RepID=UPI003D0EBEAF
MMNYLAVCLNSGGGVVRNEDTQEVMNLQIGEHESMELAIENACKQLECKHVLNGVLVKGQHKGGFLICDSQEFAAL